MSFFSLLGLKKNDSPSASIDSTHINQEMYKKSVELNERNKMLSLLRKLDEISLGSITHPDDIAQQVTSLLVTEADFSIVSIFMYDKKYKILKRLALSQTGEEKLTSSEDKMFIKEVSLLKENNILSQSANESTLKVSHTLVNVLLFAEGLEQSQKIQEAKDIKSVFVYPLIVRSDIIGVIVVCLKEEEQDVSEYIKDLLGRLVQVIGIAMDNAFLYNEVQMANERLKELDKLKDEFVSVASHELRTPMTAIKSYLWMALQGKGGPLTEKQQYYLERSYSSVDRLIKLVNDMLNISRIESGRVTIKMQAVDLQKLTKEVIDEVLPRAQELGISLTLLPEESLPQVMADPDKIKEVMFNFIGNSLKFTPQGGAINISFVQSGDMIETHVKDTGVGLLAEDMPKLFQKFGLLPGSYTVNRTASGTGLGLYISRSIVELHRGKIWGHSKGRDKGSEFGFSLKVYNEADLPIQSEQDSKEDVGLVHTKI